MSTEQFPLCKAAGLGVQSLGTGYHTSDFFIRAADLERLLESAPVVKGNIDEKYGYGFETDSCGITTYTHTARLVCIQPIVKESEERQLLRAIVEADFESDGTLGTFQKYHAALERARKLLEGK